MGLSRGEKGEGITDVIGDACKEGMGGKYGCDLYCNNCLDVNGGFGGLRSRKNRLIPYPTTLNVPHHCIFVTE